MGDGGRSNRVGRPHETAREDLATALLKGCGDIARLAMHGSGQDRSLTRRAKRTGRAKARSVASVVPPRGRRIEGHHADNESDMSGRGGRGAEMIVADSTRVAGMEQIGADEHDKVQQGSPRQRLR